MTGFFRCARVGTVVAILAVAFLVVSSPQARAVGGEGESWPSFNESDGCGSPWVRGSLVEKQGSLSRSTVLRGPEASYFGRTIGQVWDELRWWDVPGSNGESLLLHRRMQPALAEVEARLAAEAVQGRTYSIIDRYTFGYTARTVGGSYRVSQHSYGNAIDINSRYNPYRTGSLRTNMPSWFVTAWSDSGFCWGGNWISVKDAMHYNWRGPAFTESIAELPPAFAPLTSPEGFTRTMTTRTVPDALDDARFRVLMDGDGDAAIDIVSLSDTDTGTVIDVVRGYAGYKSCAVSRYWSSERATGDIAIPGDWDRDGAQDLWVIDDSDGLTVTAFLRFGDFSQTDTATIAAAGGDAYLTADHDVDGWSDLYILRNDGSTWTVEVRSGADRFATILATGSFSADPSTKFSALDRDLDQVPDLVGVNSTESFILDGASEFTQRESLPAITGTIDDVAGTDFDGDGRHDLVTLSGDKIRVYAGNTRLAGFDVTSWFEYPGFSCSDPSLAYPYDGTFRDDESSVHREDIDEISRLGVTKGCNPPGNDRFCPERTITRGELAAFLNRAIGFLPSGVNTYVDDDDSIFEDDIESLVGGGVFVACNAAGDRFCPNEVVTREVMAQFLVAAFGFEPTSTDAFIDDGSSPYQSDINAIAAVGVTKGCNPPTNDSFCPDRNVSRAEMASFMVRALKWMAP